ncbi:hypothetical protein F4604DRAFT_1786526 [Suillus subluteus]|nr:hypothetical protein F4604DRAFT_1786526 [Suillus subluteus]
MDSDAVMEGSSSSVQVAPRLPSTESEYTSSLMPNGLPPAREFRDIQVKVHIRRPEKDSWAYLGRALVSQEVVGQSSRVVVRSLTSSKVLVAFGEAVNNTETLRLLASIELACYRCRLAVVDPRTHTKSRRRIERVIKEDRRRRHRRRKDQDAMIDAFQQHHLVDDVPES